MKLHSYRLPLVYLADSSDLYALLLIFIANAFTCLFTDLSSFDVHFETSVKSITRTAPDRQNAADNNSINSQHKTELHFSPMFV